MKVIDTHQHLLYPDRFRYPWLKDVPPLSGARFGLQEYRAAAQNTGIEQTLFMEVDVDESQMEEEARFFLDLADDSASNIIGVIAAARPERGDFEAQVNRVMHPRLKGFRRVLHTQPDSLCEDSRFIANIETLARYHLTFDLCLLPRQLPRASRLLGNAGDVQFILDHCGVPNIKGHEMDAWRESIRRIAAFPNLACKVSGVAAYCDPAQVTVEAIRPYVEHCIDCFGWDRVLFGGDWPVCNLTANLCRWVEIIREILGAESVARCEQFFHRNAERIYRLNP
ncbi:MAG TPA: amidohydrolase [Verrucomicrobiae bacterium]|nr:amidohydrolase [Verrucomicrobiae bacterium]